MKDVKLSDGFKMTLDETAMDDMELVDLLVDLHDGDLYAQTKIYDKIYGEAKKALYDHLRDEKGRVPVAKMGEAFTETLRQLKAKN